MMMTVDPAPQLRRLGLIITIASLIAIAAATLTPESSPAVESHFCLICGSVGTVDAILNVVLFLPLGVGLALSGARAKNAVILVFVLSALIETAQLLLISGRDAAVGDVLTNTLGGALGFAIGRYHALWLRPPPRVARNLALGWAAIWLIIQTISSYGFALSLPHSQYYGQIARELGNFAVFPGTVLSARIGDIPIPNTALDDSRTVVRLLVANATVAASVLPAEPPPKIAPIVRVVDAQQREILLLAQDGDRFIFGVRTGAAAFRVRRPFFCARGRFSQPSFQRLVGLRLSDTDRPICREWRRHARASQFKKFWRRDSDKCFFGLDPLAAFPVVDRGHPHGARDKLDLAGLSRDPPGILGVSPSRTIVAQKGSFGTGDRFAVRCSTASRGFDSYPVSSRSVWSPFRGLGRDPWRRPPRVCTGSRNKT